jgi:hypothetical protein
MQTLKELAQLTSQNPDVQAMQQVALWIRDFVAVPSAKTGRKGPVCPFVPYALKLDTIRFVTLRISLTELEATLIQQADTFFNLPSDPSTKPFTFLLMLFPDIEEISLRITAKKMMSFFAANHMMVGPFGPNYQVASVHNPDFTDVWRAPHPIIGIRWMVEADHVFGGKCTSFDRVFGPAYEEMFGNRAADQAA